MTPNINDPIADKNRLSMAIETANFAVNAHDKLGNYNVQSHWGPEGEIYRALHIWALSDVYRIHPQIRYLETCRNLLERFRRSQLRSGGWALRLGPDGDRFKVTAAERRHSEQLEDACIAGAVLKAISDYREVSGDRGFQDVGEGALGYLASLMDPKTKRIVEDPGRSLAHLRSNPDAYYFMILSGVYAWAREGHPKALQLLPAVENQVETVYRSFDEYTMPLMVGYHFTILSGLFEHKYVEANLKPIFDHFLNAKTFRSPNVPGGYGHHDGLRGIVVDELQTRSTAGLAIAMRGWDLATHTTHYQRQDVYQECANWLDMMFDGRSGGFFEYQEPDGTRSGKGSGGQYLPIFWILGTLSRPFRT